MTRDVNTLRNWLIAALWVAAFFATIAPTLYAFTPWRSRPVGRVVMMMALCLASALDATLLFNYWHPDILVIFWFDASLFTAIAMTAIAFTIMIWRLNISRKKVEIVQFTGPAYDFFKRVAQIWLPAMGTLYFTLAQIWHLPSAEEVVGSVMAVDTFLGILLGISTSAYNNSDARFDGTMHVVNTDDGTELHLKSVDPVAITTKPSIVFKVVQPADAPSG